jgi:hypothetical protein
MNFQGEVTAWANECFGVEITNDKTERTHRFLEEALELAQAAVCTREEAHLLVDYVFNRPVGEFSQEVGGTMVTLAGLCSAYGESMDDCAATEIKRVWTKVEAIREKQRNKPKFGPLPQ